MLLILVFCFLLLCEKMNEESKGAFLTFLDLGLTYDRVDCETMWHTVMIYGVRRKVFTGMNHFLRQNMACL